MYVCMYVQYINYSHNIPQALLYLSRTKCAAEQQRQCTYNVKMTRVRVTIIAVEKQCHSLALLLKPGTRGFYLQAPLQLYYCGCGI